MSMGQLLNIFVSICIICSSIAQQEGKNTNPFKLTWDIEANRFQRHTEVRWLSLGPSVERLLAQWDAITAFVKQLGKSEKNVPKSINFKRIQLALTGLLLKLCL
jgi:hypothetical protein